MAVLSSVLLLGSILLSFAENGYALSLPASVSQTITAFPLIAMTSGTPPSEQTTPGVRKTDTPTVYVPKVLPTSSGVYCNTAPYGWRTYSVQEGETLFGLALVTNVTVSELQKANCLGTSTDLKIGQMLRLPFIPYSPPVSTAVYPPTVTSSSISSPTASWVPFIPSTETPFTPATNTGTALSATSGSISGTTATSASSYTASDTPAYQLPSSTPIPPATDTPVPPPTNTPLPPPSNTPIPPPADTPMSAPKEITPELPEATADVGSIFCPQFLTLLKV
jgi:LysM repeat protein